MKTTIEIQDLKCGGCENTINKKLSNLLFIDNLEIDVDNSMVRFDAVTPNETELVVLELSELGYPVLNERNSLGKKAKSYLSYAIGSIQK